MKAATQSVNGVRTERRQLAGFVLAGGFAAVVNLASRWLLSAILSYAGAVALAYLLGMLTAFLLTRAFIFESAGPRWKGELIRFSIVNAVSFLVVLSVSVGLAKVLLPAIGWSWHADDVAHLVGVTSPILLSFYAHKHFTFQANRK